MPHRRIRPARATAAFAAPIAVFAAFVVAGTSWPERAAHAQTANDAVHRTLAAPAPASRPPVSDETLRREYDDYRQSLAGQKWFHVRYLRMADEKQAADELKRIRSGADFATEAREKSTHTESAAHGGDLGKHASCRWGRETTAMLEKLKPGQVHPQPVRGSNGWGIYRLESVSDVVPRTFDEYREQVLAMKFEPECPWTPPVVLNQGGVAPPSTTPSTGPAQP